MPSDMPEYPEPRAQGRTERPRAWRILRSVAWRVCAVLCMAVGALAPNACPAAASAAARDSVEIARTWLTAGDYARVEPVARRLLDRLQREPGAARDSLAMATDLLVEALWRQGFATRNETVRLAEQALAWRDTTAANRDPAAVPALLNLGAIRTQNGEVVPARLLLTRACAVRRRYPGRDSLEFAAALNELAALELRAGDPAAARAAYEQVLALRRRGLGRDQPLVAWSLSNLANALESEGDFVAARKLREECLMVRTRVLPRDHPDIARALRALANDHYALGDFVRALEFEQRSMSMFERAQGTDSPEVARALTSLSGRLRALGDVPGAKRAALRALMIRERRFDPENPEIATSLLTLGRVLAETGEYRAAEDTLRRALAIRSRVFGADDPVTALVLDELARVELAQGETDSALAMCEHAIRGKRHGLGAGHPDVARSWQLLARAQWQAGDTAAASRAALETERIMREHLASSVPGLSENDALAYEATRVSGLGLAVRLAARPSASGDERQKAFDALVRSRSRVLDAMLVRGGAARTEVGLDDARRRLPAGTALVSFLRCEDEPVPFAQLARYVAFVVRSGNDSIAVCDLGTAGALDTLVAHWRLAVLSGTADGADERAARLRGERLRRQLWDPLQPALGAASRVFLVLDGALEGVDFYALPAREGGYLVESGAVIERLSAERELAAHSARAPGNGVIVAVSGASGSRGRPELPQTAREAEAVAGLWNDMSSPTSPHRSVVLRAASATVPALNAAAAGCEVLHIAAHGVFEGDGIDPLRALRAAVQGGRGRSVLLRSGLVLAAGADDPGASAGFLSARSAATLDLHATRWVVLSGCETGLGRAMAREGSIGLQRAFKLAGARVVITSLWPVEDRMSRQWMEWLYRLRWRQRVTTGEAVRGATLRALQARRRLGLSESPRTWAGFVANGFDDEAPASGAGEP